MNSVVGRNLKALRDANKLTQEKVASYLGIKRDSYANYESGLREAPVEVLEAACELFGCELDMLFSDNNEIRQCMLVGAFRADELNEQDMKEVAAFKNVVMNYMKMQRLLEQ